MNPTGQLTYVGKVGTGFNDKSLTALTRRLQTLGQDAASFHNHPRNAEARRSHWVQPELVAEVASSCGLPSAARLQQAQRCWSTVPSKVRSASFELWSQFR
jgi:ATP-dependent DNA ligase